MAPSTIHTLIFGGIGLVSVSFLVYFMFWRKPSMPAIKDKAQDKADKTEKKTIDEPRKAPVSPPATKKQPDVVVEDAESDDDEDTEGNELEELKTQYEDANRLATKYIQGQKYEKAVEKLTEALELAPRIPSAGKDILTLYNNRSAMYEKLNQFDKSLSDITVLLAMDTFHLKARVRRARIFEAQDKIRQALDEYVFAALQEQRTGNPPSHQLKIDTLGKALALKGTPALFKSLRASASVRPLPSRSHCKNFLESYPSVHLWIEHYKEVERAALVAALTAAQTVDPAAEGDAPVDAVARDSLIRQCQLDLICFDLVRIDFEAAFATLSSMTAAVADASLTTNFNSDVPLAFLTPYDNTNTLQLLSLQYELIGFERQLRCDLPGAVAAFNTSLQFYPNNVDSRLKLANVYLEQPNIAECSGVFAALLAHLDAAAAAEEGASVDQEVVKVMRAWALLHRISLFTTRNDKGEFPPAAIVESQKDVNEALELTEALQETLAGKAARVTALIRSVHIIVQSKPMVGEQVSEEDADGCKVAVARAKLLAPHNDSVIMIEAELLNNEGRADEAIALIEAATRRPDAIPNDCTPYCLKASIMINKAMVIMQNATTQGDYDTSQEILKESAELYKKAMELEPEAIEVLNQYAQYCGMLGDLELAVKLLRQALPLARTRDDVHDLNQALLLNEAQLKAVTAMKVALGVA